MPKVKSRRGAAKRFKITGSGKIKREKAFRSHMLNCKSRKRKRALRKETLVAKVDHKRVMKLLSV